MIALLRNSDQKIMNDRQGSDWKGKEKLAKCQEDLANTPETEPTKRQELQDAIDTLQAQWDAWLLRRREICAKQFGGVASDYSTIDVPEDQRNAFFTARDIEYDGNTLTYDTRPAYTIEGSVITCAAGWVRENDRLLEDDITDWSEEVLTEPLYFQLWYTQNTQTQEISVQLLVRQEDEEFSTLPGNLVKRGKTPVCEGRVNVDNTITLGRF
jgi:hypothetical protein